MRHVVKCADRVSQIYVRLRCKYVNAQISHKYQYPTCMSEFFCGQFLLITFDVVIRVPS